MTPDETQSVIIAAFRARGDAFNQFNYLLELAAELPELSDAEKTRDVLVEGCQSQVWLYPEWPGGRLRLRGDSDTLMVRGVIRIIQQMFEGCTPEEVLACELRFVEETDLAYIFDAQRKTGVSSIMQAVRESAPSGPST